MEPTRVMIAPGMWLDTTVRCTKCGDREAMDDPRAINGVCYLCSRSWDDARDESEPCLRSTDGCAIDHRVDLGPCETW